MSRNIFAWGALLISTSGACAASHAPEASAEPAGVDSGAPDGSSIGVVDASDADDVRDGGDASDGEPGDPSALCAATISVASRTAQLGAAGAVAEGLSITSDERTAAWVEYAGGQVTISYADRDSAGAAFGTPRTLAEADYARTRVALTPDGLGLAAVRANGLSFVMHRRADRASAFGDAEAGPFEALNTAGKDTLGPAGERYADPLFARDAAYFLYSHVAADDSARVMLGSRIFAMDPYSPGVPFLAATLTSVGNKRRIVTGASADFRTLFVWEESSAGSRTVTLSETATAVSSAEIGPVRDVQPTADCKAFWFRSESPAQVYRSP